MEEDKDEVSKRTRKTEDENKELMFAGPLWLTMQ